MSLRNALIILSAVLASFSISLYFQTGQVPKNVNWEQYKTYSYNEDQSFTLEEVNTKISPLSLDNIIGEIWEKNRLSGEKTRIMEIGPRNGRLLMTLKKKFPEIEFYGINRKKSHNFYRRESYIQTALHFEIMSEPELKNIELPYIVFQDLDFGQKIPYADNKFDLIFSVDVLRAIKYKFELLNEIMRVLKTDGLSLHTDFPTIPLYSQGVALDPKDAFQEIKKRGIEINFTEESKVLQFKKGDQYRAFPVRPHLPIPEKIETLSDEFRRPDMGYNLNI